MPKAEEIRFITQKYFVNIMFNFFKTKKTKLVSSLTMTKVPRPGSAMASSIVSFPFLAALDDEKMLLFFVNRVGGAPLEIKKKHLPLPVRFVVFSPRGERGIKRKLVPNT
jgi:hypothetical protein